MRKRFEKLNETLLSTVKGLLMRRLRRLLPPEGIALVFTRHDTVRFINADGSRENFPILSAWNENGLMFVKYTLPDGDSTVDSASDLYPSDILEIIKAIKR